MTIVNGYTDLATVKSELAITDTNDDTKIERSIEAASRMFDNWCGWRFWQDPTPVARTFYAYDPLHLDLMCEPGSDGISTTTGLIVELDLADNGTYGTPVTLNTDFLLEPLNAAARLPAWPYTDITMTGLSYFFYRSSYNRPTVRVTAKWGWPAVPDDVEKACIIQAARLFDRRNSPGGVQGFADFGVVRVGTRLDPDVEMLLGPYRRPAVG